MKRKIEHFSDPLFVISILLLLANDFILKDYYHNSLTGKLSDFSGLFALTYFLLTLFPGRKKFIHMSVVLFFIFWKSSLSQPLIDLWNSMGFYNIGRTVDYTDLFALPMVWLAYRYSVKGRRTIMKNYLPVPMSILALFSFCATSYIHVYEINKSYVIPFPKDEAVKRLNEISSKCDGFIPLSSYTEMADTTFIDYDGDTVSYSFKGYSYYNDTLWNYDREGKRTGIDTIYHYTYLNKDTMFLSPTGFFKFHFNVREYLNLKPDQYCSCVEVQCRLTGSGDRSLLTIQSVDTDPCPYIDPGDKGKEQLIEALDAVIEKEIIRQ